MSMALPSHLGAKLSAKNIGERVRLGGWVQHRRDHGGVIFIDLRDGSGLSQLVFHPEKKDVFAVADGCRAEYVLIAEGEVAPRPEGTVNPALPSGEVEVMVDQVWLINRAQPLPFPINDEIKVSEEVRLEHRYLDLRRSKMANILKMRSQVFRVLRGILDAHDFTEVETPILTKATPEGARDYLVPDRHNPGSFFALSCSSSC